MIYIIWKSNRNIRSVVILRGQPTFYDNWFRRYWIDPILALFGQNWENLRVLDIIQPKWVEYSKSASKKVWQHKFMTFHSIFSDNFQNYMNPELWRHRIGIYFLEHEFSIFITRSLYEKCSVLKDLSIGTNFDLVWRQKFFAERRF